MGSGGARFGAGRPSYRIKSGQVLNLDVRRLARLGYIQRDSSFTWQWSRDGEVVSRISITTHAETALTLIYTATTQGQARDYAQRIKLDQTACHFGKSRPWALCPRCGRRVALLYLRGGQFACRQCQRVSYASQSQDALGRSWGKQHKLEAKLGDDWRRPKGMRQATYDSVMAGLINCEEQREAGLAAFLIRIDAGLRRLNLTT